MELRHGKYENVEITNVPTEELKNIIAQSTNAGNPFSARELDAIHVELALREKKEKTEKQATKAEIGRADRVDDQAAKEVEAAAQHKADLAPDLPPDPSPLSLVEERARVEPPRPEPEPPETQPAVSEPEMEFDDEDDDDEGLDLEPDKPKKKKGKKK